MSKPECFVYIVEDNPSFRKSMVRLVRTSGYEAVAFESAKSFLEETSYRRPACLLLDVRLPDLDGLGLQQKLLEQNKNLPIVFMTGHGDIPMGVKAIKKGAVDFLPKPFKEEDLFKAIEDAIARDIINMKEEQQKVETKALIETLTPRELEIMTWVIAGKLNKEIAYELGIAEKTVKVHRAQVMQKTGVESVAELVRLADRAGISPAV